jgi:hypothetical protein
MNQETRKYSLDKTVFSAMKVEDADNDAGYWKKMTLNDRLDAACYLIHQFYGTTPQTPLDKSVFSKRKHLHG